MKEKLLAILSTLKAWACKVYTWSPLAVGIAIGYFGKPIIALALKAAASAIKWILG